jgi:uncharacterized protein DUF3309
VQEPVDLKEREWTRVGSSLFYGGGLLGLMLIILLILWLTGNMGGGMMIR